MTFQLIIVNFNNVKSNPTILHFRLARQSMFNSRRKGFAQTSEIKATLTPSHLSFSQTKCLYCSTFASIFSVIPSGKHTCLRTY